MKRTIRDRVDDAGITILVLAIVVLILVAAFGRGLFVNEADALRAADSQGMKDAKIVEAGRFFVMTMGCDSGDAAAFKMTGTNPSGEQVHFTVCSGWPLKGMTIRF